MCQRTTVHSTNAFNAQKQYDEWGIRIWRFRSHTSVQLKVPKKIVLNDVNRFKESGIEAKNPSVTILPLQVKMHSKEAVGQVISGMAVVIGRAKILSNMLWLVCWFVTGIPQEHRHVVAGCVLAISLGHYRIPDLLGLLHWLLPYTVQLECCSPTLVFIYIYSMNVYVNNVPAGSLRKIELSYLLCSLRLYLLCFNVLEWYIKLCLSILLWEWAHTNVWGLQTLFPLVVIRSDLLKDSAVPKLEQSHNWSLVVPQSDRCCRF